MIYYGTYPPPITSDFERTILYSNLTDQDATHLRITPQDKNDLTEEVLTEASVYFGMLYHLIEVFKGHADFADELSKYFLNPIVLMYR
jgi:hypothetical protein